MKFAVISPTSGLERYASLSTCQMVLAHLCITEVGAPTGYMSFYQKMRERGDTIILDNGAYENGEPMPLEILEPIIHMLRPNVVCLPDYLLQDPKLTISASLRALDRWVDRFASYDLQYMFIPQAPAGELMDVMRGVEIMLNDTRVGPLVTWIGLPRALHTHFGHMRAWVAMMIKRAYPHLKLHALGSGAGSLDEFNLLKQTCESMDSSSPVWRGYKGFGITQPGWPDYPVDFSAPPPSEANHPLILQNLLAFTDEISGSASRAVN